VDEVAPAIAKTTDEQAAGIAAECAVSLWDRAYDDLKQEKRSIIPTYEDLLSRVLIKCKL
jgi:DNA/RNA-binding domain of Phe-tRNA-synthetase-like protein